MVRNHIPEGVGILPSTWAFNIKRYPDKRFHKFKAIFFVREEFQQDGVKYTEPYFPVVVWSTDRALL